MKQLTLFFSILLAVALHSGLKSQESIPPYFRVVTSDKSVTEATEMVKSALTDAGFEILGSYHPANNPDWTVVAFTRNDLKEVCYSVKERGALAAVLRAGIMAKDGKTEVSFLNPMYQFWGYLRENVENHKVELNRVNKDVATVMKSFGGQVTGFGGNEEPDDLVDYHYMAFMPYFTDPVELKTFSSFSEGLNTIRKNLSAGKGNTVKVYELTDTDRQVAVFGVGLHDPDEGEGHFLPIIGADHLPAMPYEIILQGKEATMLHGKFRFAIFWPELSMSEFMKIVSTPGDVEDALEALTE
ncbi:MAG: hypothetical protein Kow00127_04220 [Bacteroidales bacterium]